MPRRALSFSVAFLAPASALLGHELGGWLHFATPVLLLGVLPLVDLLLGADASNPSSEEVEALRRSPLYRSLLYVWVPAQLALLIWGASLARTLDVVAFCGLVASVSLCTGAIGITVAHELIHGSRRLERALGGLLLATVSYPHFAVEHIEGHHRRVATPEDPASAREGQSVYAFWWQSVLGGFRSAFRLERERLAGRGLPRYGFGNRVLSGLGLSLVIASGLGLAFGARALGFFVAQSVFAFSLLEVVNYIEHYGLERRTSADGRFEPVASGHSWNADFRLSNAFLFGLQRHSDHHLHPRRPYQTLRHLPESPHLPAGYAGMLWLAVVPPLWRRVMDPRLRDFRRSLERAFAAGP